MRVGQSIPYLAADERGAPPLGYGYGKRTSSEKKKDVAHSTRKHLFLTFFSSKNRFLGEKESEIYKFLHLFNWGPISTKHPGGTLG